MAALLELRDVSKSFQGLRAVDHVSFKVDAGEILSIIGPNGAGKTTLFNLINGQIGATSGRILLFGADITRLPPHRRAALGLARTFQITNLFPSLSVMENMLIAVQALDPCHFVFFRRLASYRDVLKRAQDLLERWDLWHLKDERVSTLSYGIQRQLEIVLALAGFDLERHGIDGLQPAEIDRQVFDRERDHAASLRARMRQRMNRPFGANIAIST